MALGSAPSDRIVWADKAWLQSLLKPARTMLYMADIYGFRLSNQDQQLYTAWNGQDPPDAWEIEPNRRIEQVQGVGNRYISDYAALAGRAGTAM